jgi:hypothetical protein
MGTVWKLVSRPSESYALSQVEPRIGVARADPAVVRQVRAEEEATERGAPAGGEGDAGASTQGRDVQAVAGAEPAGVNADRAGNRVRTAARFRG